MKKAWLVWEHCDHVDSADINDARILFEDPESSPTAFMWARIVEIVWCAIED